MSYDAENRIATATKNGVTTTYTYDADGNRVKKTSGSSGTLYWYMAQGIAAESDISGTLKSEYIFFNGERVARKDFPAGNVFYYFSDHLKTASVITDSAGNIKDESDYYPWGGELQFTSSGTNHYKFTGKERDAETGLDYFGARHYSSGLGRFITPDWSSTPVPLPYDDLADPQSLNQYGYVRNIPTVGVDPDGHQTYSPAPLYWTLGAAGRLATMAQKGSQLVAAAGAVLSRVTTVTVATVVVTASYLISPGTGGMTNDKDTIHSNPPPGTQTKADVVHEIDPAKHPETAGHVKDAQAAGKPTVVTVDKTNAKTNRGDALKGTQTVPGKDRDEYPPASTAEGGKDASVRHVDPSDNRGAGASWGQTIKNLPDGTKVEIKVKEQK